MDESNLSNMLYNLIALKNLWAQQGATQGMLTIVDSLLAQCRRELKVKL